MFFKKIRNDLDTIKRNTAIMISMLPQNTVRKNDNVIYQRDDFDEHNLVADVKRLIHKWVVLPIEICHDNFEKRIVYIRDASIKRTMYSKASDSIEVVLRADFLSNLTLEDITSKFDVISDNTHSIRLPINPDYTVPSLKVLYDNILIDKEDYILGIIINQSKNKD